MPKFLVGHPDDLKDIEPVEKGLQAVKILVADPEVLQRPQIQVVLRGFDLTAHKTPCLYRTIFPETPIVPQEGEGDDTSNVEAEGMDQTQEANENGF
ncbi:MAG: hypothetical protein M3534_00740 [Actinomycetota bacterium]|jgi:hypothetical protein|nr:hypothetical protein [Actinomycetota bacterium]